MPRKIRPIRVEGDIAYVTLTQGKEAIIDAADAVWAGEHNWHAWKPDNSRNWYARTMVRREGKKACIMLHREICGTPDGMDTDHIDGDGLNNRRANLRPATRAENCRNAKLSRASKTGLKGATWHKRHKAWQCVFTVNRKQYHLGYFDTPEKAHEAYCEASKRLHGEFGRTE